MEEENKISINAATKDQLQELNGIGEVRAQSIIDYRKEHGNFKNIEDIKNVKGIGDVVFRNIEDRITLYSKKELLGKKISKKVAETKHVIAHKTKEELLKLKNIIALLPTNIRKSVLSGEVKALNVAKNIKESTIRTIDSAILKGKNIKEKFNTKIGKIATISKNAVALLKQELSMEKNTLRFKQFMASIQNMGLQAQNTVLKGANRVKDGAIDLKYRLEDKVLLTKNKIQTKIVNKKNAIVRKTASQIASIKTNIKNFFQSKKQNIQDKVQDVKYNIVSKYDIIKNNIKTKVSNSKKVIATKTNEQVDRIKQVAKNFASKVSDKAANIKETFSVSDEKLESYRQRIEELKQQRDSLLSDLFSKEAEANSHVR